jgi:hypothetical protein
MGYIWVGLQLSVAKSLIFPRGVGQTRQTAPCLQLGTRKDMTKVLQFGQPSSTVHISGSGESRNLFEPALLYFNSYVQDATAQQIGGSFGKMFGFLAVLSKDDGPDGAKVEA